MAASRDIAALLALHRDTIDALKAATVAALPATRGADSVPWDGIWLRYDDIFYLRYVLSFPGARDEAEDAVRKAVAWRQDPANRDGLLEIAEGKMEEWGCWQELRKYVIGELLPDVQEDGGAAMLAPAHEKINRGVIYDVMARDEHIKIFMAHKEQSFQYCDEVARRTGKLVKVVTLFDMHNLPLSIMMDKRQGSIFGEVSEKSSWLYPQMADKTVIVNAPAWMSFVVGFFRRVLPAKTMDKIQVYSSIPSMWKSDWAKSTLSCAKTPDLFGGERTDYPDLYRGSALRASGEQGGLALKEVVVSARSSHELALDVPAPGTVSASVSVASHGIEARAVLRPGDTVLMEVAKIKAEDGCVKWTWHCGAAGTVVLVLDNTYSRLRSKTVRYTLEVTGIDGT